ncbi:MULTISPECIES: recombinase family protein [Vibrio]|uniref:recombinase family protein n=1 Tax=Vibrio TaxID=662 RepID=UPI000B5C5FCA|nr:MULTISPECIES: recombinase family protein [Vibrio]HBV75978.1 recombinase family protein [Vibrio sp.]
MSQPKIYIYRRVSSERQTKKSGLEIQVSDKTLSDLQEKYPDYSLVELANDAGLSAYHGKHLEATTALTEFIQACKSGKIPKGSILAVYSLDRLSRLKLGAAYEQVFIPIVENGVKIYSETEARIYQNDDTDYILATVLFSRAHNESKTKAKRNRDAIINAVKKWQDEKTFTANLTSAPFWIDNSTGKLNSLSESALFIVDSLIRGIGYKTISEQLQDKYPLPPQRNTSKAGTFWTIETIYKLRSNKALLGNKQVTIKDENGKQQDFTLDDYYQPLITWDTWQQLQKTKANKKRTYTDNIYLLSDLKSVLVCGECGYSMAATANKSSSNKRAKYFCCGASSKKSNHLLWKLDVETLERIVLLLINEGLEDGVKRITSPDYLRQVEEHNAKLEQAETTLEDIKTRWNSTQSPTMLDLMLQQEIKIKELQQKVDEHKALTDTVKNTDSLNDY